MLQCHFRQHIGNIREEGKSDTADGYLRLDFEDLPDYVQEVIANLW